MWFSGECDVFIPSTEVIEIFDKEQYSLEGKDVTIDMGLRLTAAVRAGSAVIDEVVGNPAAREVIRKILVWIGLPDNILGDPPAEVGIENDDVRRTVFGAIEVICSQAIDPEDCLATMEDILESGYVGASEMNHNILDEDWMAENSRVISVAMEKTRDSSRFQCTYSMSRPADGNKYYGRTSAKSSENCTVAVQRRSQQHKRNPVRFGDFSEAVLDKPASGVAAYPAIRGREQQLIDSHVYTDGVSEGILSPKVENLIRGVSRSNPFGCTYWEASTLAFPPAIGPYTGNGNCP